MAFLVPSCAIVVVVSIGDAVTDSFTFPWSVYAAVLVFGLFVAAYRVWLVQFQKTKRYEDWLENPELKLVCGDGDPFHSVDQNNRPVFRIGVENESVFDRENVSVEIFAIEGGYAREIPFELRSRSGDKAHKVSIPPGKTDYFDVAKIVPSQEGIFLLAFPA
jgi:hypothetical protein